MLKYLSKNIRNILILGYGSTGQSVASYLKIKKVSYKIFDENNIDIKDDFINNISIESLELFDLIICSPGIDTRKFKYKNLNYIKVAVISDIDFFSTQTKNKIITITGSNGKTTVTTLLTKCLQDLGQNAIACGNIGLPVCTALLDDENIDYYVIEISSFQLEKTYSLRSEISILTNLSADHLDRYDSVKEYFYTKMKIANLSKKLLIDFDNKEIKNILDNNIYSTKLININDKHNIIFNNNYFYQNEKIIFETSNLKIKSHHDYQNISMVLNCLFLLNFKLNMPIKTIQNFKGLAHRLEYVGKIFDVDNKIIDIFNDSKATNIGATISALNNFKDKSVALIIGGDGKSQDFSKLQNSIDEKVATLIFFGKDGRTMLNSLDTKNINFILKVTLQESIEYLKLNKNNYDVILFSPACASFDQYENYLVRGNIFKKLINKNFNIKI